MFYNKQLVKEIDQPILECRVVEVGICLAVKNIYLEIFANGTTVSIHIKQKEQKIVTLITNFCVLVPVIIMPFNRHGCGRYHVVPNFCANHIRC